MTSMATWKCLDFRNNSNHCGKRNNVCEPKNCISGRCYKPSHEECTSDQAAGKNRFARARPNWTLVALAPSVQGTDVKLGISYLPPPSATYPT